MFNESKASFREGRELLLRQMQEKKKNINQVRVILWIKGIIYLYKVAVLVVWQ